MAQYAYVNDGRSNKVINLEINTINSITGKLDKGLGTYFSAGKLINDSFLFIISTGMIKGKFLPTVTNKISEVSKKYAKMQSFELESTAHMKRYSLFANGLQNDSSGIFYYDTSSYLNQLNGYQFNVGSESTAISIEEFLVDTGAVEMEISRINFQLSLMKESLSSYDLGVLEIKDAVGNQVLKSNFFNESCNLFDRYKEGLEMLLLEMLDIVLLIEDIKKGAIKLDEDVKNLMSGGVK